MTRFRDLDLRRYHVSPISGFLPEPGALDRLPDPYYDAWETAITNMPKLIQRKELQARLDSLAVLSTGRLQTEEEWRRAYVVLSFLSQGYIWNGDEPRRRLPLSIVSPLRIVAERLRISPCATFATYCLWNVTLKAGADPDCAEPDNYLSISTFTSSKEEEWFYVISVAIEAQGGRIIAQALEAIDAVHDRDQKVVLAFLKTLVKSIDRISQILLRLYDNLSQDFFFHRLRPFLRGSKNMAEAGLPDGIFYPRCDCNGGGGEWLLHSGGSNAQSSLIQLLDIILGVEQSVGFIKEMRKYMPGPHKDFLERMSDISNIRGYAMGENDDSELRLAYNKAISRLRAFRDEHIRIVARYIFIPAGRNGTADRVRCLQDSQRGTGGTDIMQFLRMTRNTTKPCNTQDDCSISPQQANQKYCKDPGGISAHPEAHVIQDDMTSKASDTNGDQLTEGQFLPSFRPCSPIP
ncbi:Indoleamine 2,3-dioxygenase [Aspergillus karnatakaensis]|uniref:indoleamine 2,3-dioxygenase n=1 Tax=Aspergillus karnatakaensis TaxID=1810916 RepID=UPI003CCD37EA